MTARDLGIAGSWAVIDRPYKGKGTIMANLSSRGEVGKTYDIVIVGSGYGGSIAACRFARAVDAEGRKPSVCLLERGREIRPGSYPDSLLKVARELQTDPPQVGARSAAGLFDYRINQEVDVLVGCGLGGTSLINANVAVEPDPAVLQHADWPADIRNDRGGLLKQGFTEAKRILTPEPYPEGTPGFPTLNKLQALRNSAAALQTTADTLPLNVTFKDGPNSVGVHQKKCVLCGDCVTGCNHLAKNTLLMNYLPDAARHGAQIFSGISVQRLSTADGHWNIHYRVLNENNEEFSEEEKIVKATTVILAAGTLGSTEILLRSSKDIRLSSSLGQRFSGNGDFIAVSYNGDSAIDGVGDADRSPDERAQTGPCITAGIRVKGQTIDDQILIEDGSIAAGIRFPMPALLAAEWRFSPSFPDDFKDVRKQLRIAASFVRGPYHGAVRHTQTHLVMGHDKAGGKIALDDRGRARIVWENAHKEFQNTEEALRVASSALNGAYVPTPNWRKDKKLITVHPLGGCAMADDAQHGVVNDRGQVFSSPDGTDVYRDLYVADGAVIPRSLGVNPLLTIAALAERMCFIAASDRKWTIDYSLPAGPLPEPPGKGLILTFNEKMEGRFSNNPRWDHRKAAKNGIDFSFKLRMTTDDLYHFIDDANLEHEARAEGTVSSDFFRNKDVPAKGLFNLFCPDPEHLDDLRRYRLMLYRLQITDGDRLFFMEGVKKLHADQAKRFGLEMWRDTTTLLITLYEGDSNKGRLIGRGILRIDADDFLRLIRSMDVPNASDEDEERQGKAAFSRFFFESLQSLYGLGWDPMPRRRRALDLPEPVRYPEFEKRTGLRLTRYRRGEGKGPVLVAHAFGTSSEFLLADTIDTNFTEYLCRSGYDVWLFDWSASTKLDISRESFTIDKVARKDYPAAVDFILETTGAANLQVVAHCVGSMSFLMSALTGQLENKVRSAVCSAVGIYPLPSWVNKVKAFFGVDRLFKLFGIKSVTTNYDDDSSIDLILERLLKWIFRTQCNPLVSNPICHRIFGIYGETYLHSQLNQLTHDAIDEMFGAANIQSFGHLLLMFRKGKVVDAGGKNVYLGSKDIKVKKFLRFPITLIHGKENREFPDKGTKATFEKLVKLNGPELYRYLSIENYGHMDTFIGKNASHDVYPHIVEQLDRFNVV